MWVYRKAKTEDIPGSAGSSSYESPVTYNEIETVESCVTEEKRC